MALPLAWLEVMTSAKTKFHDGATQEVFPGRVFEAVLKVRWDPAAVCDEEKVPFVPGTFAGPLNELSASDCLPTEFKRRAFYQPRSWELHSRHFQRIERIQCIQQLCRSASASRSAFDLIKKVARNSWKIDQNPVKSGKCERLKEPYFPIISNEKRELPKTPKSDFSSVGRRFESSRV